MQTNLKENFEQYFQIEETNQINLFPVEENMVPKNQAQLEAAIPPLFRLANEINELDLNALRPLRNLGDVASDLAAYLQAQSRKIDLIMSHILANEQPEDESSYCDSYGGGGIKVTTAEKFQIGQNFRTKIFLQHEASAIFCYSQIIEISKQEDEALQYTLAFTQIRDSDQELLVRASLHAQTRQLKKRQSDNESDQNS
ncbi:MULTISPECIES: PilZ domain-containing protein [Pseudoalteromonas]|uniref:PilZ domain-containing protein n=1 Tax=Pseudoalteromonas obscura TaxID=3048491 RepID=A0ABT7EG10_9GAMM|nr:MULTISPECIES: PilZ domain-containing protein [Pseudoalteromonas]MBQ4838597.1 PilZ domain-containing protein [Pseudoalteromonas luteoviolacea]MDK2593642.1 PilZ domain-containing protein [Pseudoalteromonas sp. P94(2023)]